MFDGVRTILPEGAVVAGGETGPDVWPLFPAEEQRARVMAPKRRLEFGAGRHYAREALAALGQARVGIPVLPSRAPGWPPGIVGSISHSRSVCLAVAARRCGLVSIGVDIESDEPLLPGLVPMICRPGDLNDRLTLERSLGLDLPKLVFVLKEAFYKAYYPVTGCFLDFADVDVAVEAGSRAFEARLVRAHAPCCAGYRALCGRFGRGGGFLFAVSWLRA